MKSYYFAFREEDDRLFFAAALYTLQKNSAKKITSVATLSTGFKLLAEFPIVNSLTQQQVLDSTTATHIPLPLVKGIELSDLEDVANFEKCKHLFSAITTNHLQLARFALSKIIWINNKWK